MATKQTREEYESNVAAFLARNGITSFYPREGGESYFSWRGCECCKSRLGGDRYDCTSFQFATREVIEVTACSDCVFYAAYGQLPTD
jgi:hypothetical protein